MSDFGSANSFFQPLILFLAVNGTSKHAKNIIRGSFLVNITYLSDVQPFCLCSVLNVTIITMHSTNKPFFNLNINVLPFCAFYIESLLQLI